MPEPWVFDVLPCRPPPYPGECLSGYLVRLAEANGGATAGDLVRDLFPAWTHPHQLRLLRWEYPLDGWGRLPLRTRLAPADLARLTVAPWVAKFRPPPVVAHPDHRSPASALHGAVTPTLRVCPRCLDAEPSVRLLWRLAPVGACLEHGCLLQTACPGCAQPLAVIGPAQRPLRCARCGADLRASRAAPAPAAVLAAQQRRQADLRFLLDPAVTLVSPPPAGAGPAPDLPRAIGLKFRYARTRAGWSVGATAHRLAVSAGTVTDLERGRRAAALPLLLAYLDVLSVSWPEFAALEVPAEFVRRLHEPPDLPLRRCPTPTCPNHRTPSGTGVTRMADLPARRVARFRCKACGRAFTRGYDGALTAKPRRPPIRPGDPPPVVKSADETARLVALGRRGLPNRQIAGQLGWGEKTVRSYWIALRLEEAIHRAQARRRARAVQRRRATLRRRVAAILVAFQRTEEEITLARVGRALGRNADYLQTTPEVAAMVRAAALPHNALLRRRRHDAVETRVVEALAEATGAADPPSTLAIARRAGVDRDQLQVTHPDLYARVRRTVEAGRAAMRTARRQRQIALINAAAARMVADGSPLTYTSLLATAGVDRLYGFRDPIIHDLLEQWIGDPTPPG
ncbi:MAG TPA: TniQ family protein [Chloroflexota bacterium]|jgi:DNA-binding CsgD family transcriptional regulator